MNHLLIYLWCFAIHLRVGKNLSCDLNSIDLRIALENEYLQFSFVLLLMNSPTVLENLQDLEDQLWMYSSIYILIDIYNLKALMLYACLDNGTRVKSTSYF